MSGARHCGNQGPRQQSDQSVEPGNGQGTQQQRKHDTQAPTKRPCGSRRSRAQAIKGPPALRGTSWLVEAGKWLDLTSEWQRGRRADGHTVRQHPAAWILTGRVYRETSAAAAGGVPRTRGNHESDHVTSCFLRGFPAWVGASRRRRRQLSAGLSVCHALFGTMAVDVTPVYPAVIGCSRCLFMCCEMLVACGTRRIEYGMILHLRGWI